MKSNSTIYQIVIVCMLIIIMMMGVLYWKKGVAPSNVPSQQVTDQYTTQTGSQFPVQNSGGAYAVLFPLSPNEIFVQSATAAITVSGSVTSVTPADSQAKGSMILKLHIDQGDAIPTDFYLSKTDTLIYRLKNGKQELTTVYDLTKNTPVTVTMSKDVKGNGQWTVSSVTILK